MEKKQGNIVAIITMIFLFGMISFVTNLAAPIGVIWKQAPGIEGSNALGMMGNMMNFLAYLFMGSRRKDAAADRLQENRARGSP